MMSPGIISRKFTGFHGNCSPLGSFMTSDRPSRDATLPLAASSSISVGMPDTLNFLANLVYKINNNSHVESVHYVGTVN